MASGLTVNQLSFLMGGSSPSGPTNIRDGSKDGQCTRLKIWLWWFESTPSHKINSLLVQRKNVSLTWRRSLVQFQYKLQNLFLFILNRLFIITIINKVKVK